MKPNRKPPPDAPETRERARRVGGQYVTEAPVTTCPHCRAILFIKSGKCEECGKRVTPPPLERKVIDNWPLKRLHVRGPLTDTQFAAGHQYYQHWYAAGLSPFGSIDMGGAGRSTTGPSYGMASSEK